MVVWNDGGADADADTSGPGTSSSRGLEVSVGCQWAQGGEKQRDSEGLGCQAGTGRLFKVAEYAKIQETGGPWVPNKQLL